MAHTRVPMLATATWACGEFIAYLTALPTSVQWMLAVFWFLMFLIWDTGAGAPIFWVFVKPFCEPFEATASYREAKRRHAP